MSKPVITADDARSMASSALKERLKINTIAQDTEDAIEKMATHGGESVMIYPGEGSWNEFEMPVLNEVRRDLEARGFGVIFTSSLGRTISMYVSWHLNAKS